jgi:hypothetical protein
MIHAEHHTAKANALVNEDYMSGGQTCLEMRGEKRK